MIEMRVSAGDLQSVPETCVEWKQRNCACLKDYPNIA